MTREEFLKKLKEALENDLSGRIVQENVSYYESYIIEEIRKGRTESEVIEELGVKAEARQLAFVKESREPGRRTMSLQKAVQGRKERRTDMQAAWEIMEIFMFFPWTVGGKSFW